MRSNERLRLKHLHSFYTRHGSKLYYFRRRGVRQRLPNPADGYDEFMAAYTACLNGQEVETRGAGATRTKNGSYAAAIAGFMSSAAYASLAPNSRRAYRPSIEFIRQEFGDVLVGKLGRGEIGAVITAKAQKAPGAANDLLKAFRAVIKHAMLVGMVDQDPTIGLKKLRQKNPDGHYSWSDPDIDRFRAHHPIGSLPRLAFEILLATGLRRGDAVQLGRQHIRPDGKLQIVPEKTKRHGTVVLIPIMPELAAVLALVPRDRLAFIAGPSGQAISGDRLGRLFRTWCDDAGLPAQMTAHGGRKALVRRLVEAGVPEADIAAVTGHMDYSLIRHYGKAHNKEKGAERAFAKLAANG
jgi:integrase